jgi:hypothetical protein
VVETSCWFESGQGHQPSLLRSLGWQANPIFLSWMSRAQIESAMSKKSSSHGKVRKGRVLGRERFGKISEVEGIHLSGSMKRAFAEFDRKGMSAAERRRDIIGRYKRPAG